MAKNMKVDAQLDTSAQGLDKQILRKMGGTSAHAAKLMKCAAAAVENQAPKADRDSTSIDAWVIKITQQVEKSAQSLVELGQLFIDAKEDLGHGKWQDMFAPNKLRFSQRTAEKLMQVAKNTALANPPNSASLPPSLDALVTLAQMDAQSVQSGIDQGSIGPCMTIAQAKQLVHDKLEQKPTKPKKPFAFNAFLKFIVEKVNLKVPNEQREKFLAALTEQIKSQTPKIN